jgi:hypothetical protein
MRVFDRRFKDWIPAFAGMTATIGMFVLMVFCLQGCAMVGAGRHQTSSLSKIKLDMRAEKVQKKMGRPDAVRVGKKLVEDKNYELHEYKLYDSSCVKTLSVFVIVPVYPFCSSDTYWLHYINSELVFWGEEGDWRGTPKAFTALYGGPPIEQPKAEENPPKSSEIK